MPRFHLWFLRKESQCGMDDYSNIWGSNFTIDLNVLLVCNGSKRSKSNHFDILEVQAGKLRKVGQWNKTHFELLKMEAVSRKLDLKGGNIRVSAIDVCCSG